MKLKSLMFIKSVPLSLVLLSITPVLAQEKPVEAQTDDLSSVKLVAAELAVVNAEAAYGNLTLPTNINGATITWSSEKEKLVSANGEITRPKGRDAKVVLHATITKGTATATRDIKVRVVKAFRKAEDQAYLFVHFTFKEEKIHSIRTDTSTQYIRSGKLTDFHSIDSNTI